MSKYVFAEAVAGKLFCPLDGPENIDLSARIALQPWPSNVAFRMNPNFPKMVRIADWAKTMRGVIVASPKLKALIEAERPADVEYLPITIFDHKGRMATSEHFVINPYHLRDAIDKDASKLRWNAIDPEKISGVGEMIIKESLIPHDAKIFRLKHFSNAVMLTRELAGSIEAAGISGVDFTEIEDIEA